MKKQTNSAAYSMFHLIYTDLFYPQITETNWKHCKKGFFCCKHQSASFLAHNVWVYFIYQYNTRMTAKIFNSGMFFYDINESTLGEKSNLASLFI